MIPQAVGPTGGILYYAVQGAFFGFIDETRVLIQIKVTEKYLIC